jgi:hypothetical protein
MEAEVTEYWGPRCPDYEPECPCCKAWAHFDKTGEVLKVDEED